VYVASRRFDALQYSIMAKKNSRRQNRQQTEPLLSKLPRIQLDIPDRTKAVIAAVCAWSGALIITLSYLNLGGVFGSLVARLFTFLLGDSRWLLVGFFVFLGSLFIRPKREEQEQERGMAAGVFGSLLILAAFLGMIDLVATGRAGWIGKIIGSIHGIFGFWVSGVIFITLGFVGIALGLWEPLRELFTAWRARRGRAPLPRMPQDAPDLEQELREPAAPAGAAQKVSSAEPDADRRSRRSFQKPDAPKRQLVNLDWTFPSPDLLEDDGAKPTAGDTRVNAQIIQRTLEDFGIPVEMGDVHVGPTVTQYTLKPAQGIKLSRIVALQNDLALALAAHPIRLEAPIPGKSLVGVEVPNRIASLVRLKRLMQEPEYRADAHPLAFFLGRDVMGAALFSDLAKLPHLLVAGATGSGKSIFIHSLVVSYLYRNPPQLLKLILIDPKRVELTAYNGIPYLLAPVITDGRTAIAALKWAAMEMDRRYDVLLEAQSRDIGSYNTKYASEPDKLLPSIVIVIDELADLMTSYGKELESIIIRLSQMARATGIHLVVATQRPSVEVVTGLIKANIPSRIAFQVASQVDSRTILDCAGAEKLLGRGDLLFISADTSKPRRIQGPLVSEQEVERVVKSVQEIARTKQFAEANEPSDLEQFLAEVEQGGSNGTLLDGDDGDELYREAYMLVVKSQKASASFLQRHLKVGYARAARLLDLLEARGVIGPGQGAKPREVYHSADLDLPQNSVADTKPDDEPGTDTD
jgi:S-DNA-T family DNA segregation ATPase FtsK/SpoIIIE